ncbi:uncharacterized protein [Venturia canescens]|uniref:uncharacterized protein n=1 Tax=Venturia canescens TaxID=32260 RepID=UPI001C9C249A|nr:uncharacterized protein LOC122409680 [Venturia canescens]
MNLPIAPSLGIHKAFLVTVGLWPHQSGIVKYLLLFNTIFFTASQGYLQIGGMIAAWEDKNVFLESIPPVLVDFMCAAKIVNFLANFEKMQKLLFTLEEDWQKFKGRKEIEILDRYVMQGRMLTVTYAGCLYGSMVPFMIIPAVPLFMDIFVPGNETRTRLLMFRVDFLLDTEKYYYPLLIHSYFGTMAYITLVVAIDTILMIYVLHACGSFAVLGYQLEHLMDGVDIDVDLYPHKKNDTSYYNMSECILQHNHALEYSKFIEEANYKSYFFQMAFTMVCLSFTGFQTVMYLEEPQIAIRYFAFSVTQLLLLLLQSYPGQMLYDHSIEVSNYVNNCGWYQTSIRTRKLVCLMTMRSRIPCAMTAGKFYILNVANFSAVRMSYENKYIHFFHFSGHARDPEDSMISNANLSIIYHDYICLVGKYVFLLTMTMLRTRPHRDIETRQSAQGNNKFASIEGFILNKEGFGVYGTMDLLPNPHLAINKKFLSAIGMWPYQTGFMKSVLLFNLLFFIGSQGFFQIGGMIAAWRDKNVFLESIPPVLIDVVCCAKVINFLLNFEKMKELLSALANDWEKFKGREEIEVLNKYAMNGRKLTLSYAGCMYGSMIPFMIIPVVPNVMNALSPANATVARQLMFRVDYLLDAEKYYYLLLIHSYFGTMAYITLVIAIDTMLMTYVQHACGSFAVLNYQLDHLMDGIDIDVDVYPDKANDTRYTGMAECVAQHTHTLQYAKRIEDAIYKFNFIQLGITMVCLSFTGFQTVVYADAPGIAVRYIAFSITQLILLFLQSYPGQILYDHSVLVSDFVHNCEWYLTSIRTRKLFYMMTMRSRKPCFLTAGRFYVLNLANFSAVIRTSISYLTVLTSVR